MKLPNKKADGLSLTTVVIAAIALIVLIVLVLIFSGRLNLFNNTVNACPANTQATTESGLSADGMCLNGELPSKVIDIIDPATKLKIKNYCCPTTKMN